SFPRSVEQTSLPLSVKQHMSPMAAIFFFFKQKTAYEIERGEQDLWIFDVKTNSGRRLTSDPAIRDAPVWSPDSRTLAFLNQADGSAPKVHVRGSEANDAEETMPAADFQMPADWSPDG